MPGSARRRFTADFPSAGPVPPRNTASNSFVLKILPITPMDRRICAQILPISMKTRNFRGRGEGGTQLTPLPNRESSYCLNTTMPSGGRLISSDCSKPWSAMGSDSAPP